MKGDINPRIAATRDFLDQMLGTFEEWIEANLPDDDSLPEASRIRELLEQYREAALQRKIAISAAASTMPRRGRRCPAQDIALGAPGPFGPHGF
jgi:hypothetical protein